jgi:hypothetical protein
VTVEVQAPHSINELTAVCPVATPLVISGGFRGVGTAPPLDQYIRDNYVSDNPTHRSWTVRIALPDATWSVFAYCTG